MRWTVHSEKPLYEDEWLDIRLADVELPDGRHLEHRLIRTPPGAGCVIVKDRRVLLLWRHRFITDTWGWEIPVGKIDPGEDPVRAAARETEEETGWRPGSLTSLLPGAAPPGISDCVHLSTSPTAPSASARPKTTSSPTTLAGYHSPTSPR